MDDIYSMDLGTPDAQTAAAAALRRQRDMGQLAMLTGDKVLSPFGQSQVTAAQQGQQWLAQTPERNLARQKAGVESQQLTEAGSAQSPISVLSRSLTAKALGGPVDESVTSQQLQPMLPLTEKWFAAEHKNDAQRGDSDVNSMRSQQAVEMWKLVDPENAERYLAQHPEGASEAQIKEFLGLSRVKNVDKKYGQGEERLNLAKAKMGLSLGERGLQFPDVGAQGPELQPVPTKKQSETLSGSLVALGRAEPQLDKLELALHRSGGRMVPGTSAYAAADQARAQLVPLINQIEQMAPGMPKEHQKLLEAQLSSLTNWKTLINPEQALIQIQGLRESLARTPKIMQQQFGAKGPKAALAGNPGNPQAPMEHPINTSKPVLEPGTGAIAPMAADRAAQAAASQASLPQGGQLTATDHAAAVKWARDAIEADTDPSRVAKAHAILKVNGLE